MNAPHLETQEIPVRTTVLVWGASLAGLKAASGLAALGYAVLLADSGKVIAPSGIHDPIQTANPEAVAALMEETKSNPRIQVLTEATLTACEGVAGDFEVSIISQQRSRTEKVGAMVLAPEVELIRREKAYGTQPHPRIISQTKLEDVLADPERAEELLNPRAESLEIVFIIGLAGESPPVALGRALQSAAALLQRGNCQVFLLIGNAQVADFGLEQQMRDNQEAGMLIFKLLAPPELITRKTKPEVIFIDPVLRQPVTLTPHLLVLDETYQPAADSDTLAALLRLKTAANGFLQDNNVHNLPVFSNRRGIYLIGPARQPMDLEKAFADAEDAVLEVYKLLGQGTATAPKGRAQIDRGRCTLCLTCYRLCPHAAITWDHRAVISELACQGCGICASECPMDAIQIQPFSDDSIAATLKNLRHAKAPRIIAFLCRQSAWRAYVAARDDTALPPGFIPIQVPCAGKVDVDYLLQAFTCGADGVLVLSCHPGNCQSCHGNELARWRVERATALLQEAGIAADRLVFKTVAANQPREFRQTVAEMAANLQSEKS